MTKSKRRRIGVGMLGYGFMGKVHTECYRMLRMWYETLPVEVRFVGVATKHLETAEFAVEQAGYDFGTTDWREVVEHPDVDVVNICTPNALHFEQAMGAIQSGKHVYCDKPLTTNPEHARTMANAAQRAGVVHQVTQNYRFVPATLRAKQLVDEGLLGRPYSFRAAYLHSGSSDPERPAGWKMQDGGTLHDLGAHVVDLVRHLWGDFAEVLAHRQVFVPSRPVRAGASERVPISGDDAAWMLAKLANGAIGTIETNKVATGTEDELRIELHGEKGAIRLNLMEPNWLDVYDARAEDGPYGGNRGFLRIATCSRRNEPSVIPPPRGAAGWMQFHLASLHSFVGNVLRGCAGHPDFFDGWAVHEVLAAAEESSRTGNWVRVRTVNHRSGAEEQR